MPIQIRVDGKRYPKQIPLPNQTEQMFGDFPYGLSIHEKNHSFEIINDSQITFSRKGPLLDDNTNVQEYQNSFDDVVFKINFLDGGAPAVVDIKLKDVVVTLDGQPRPELDLNATFDVEAWNQPSRKLKRVSSGSGQGGKEVALELQSFKSKLLDLLESSFQQIRNNSRLASSFDASSNKKQKSLLV